MKLLPTNHLKKILQFAIGLSGTKIATLRSNLYLFRHQLATLRGVLVLFWFGLATLRSSLYLFRHQLATLRGVLVLFWFRLATLQQFYTTFHNFSSLLRKKLYALFRMYLYSPVFYIQTPISLYSSYYKWFIQVRFSLPEARLTWNNNVLRHQTDMQGSRFLLQGVPLAQRIMPPQTALIEPTNYSFLMLIQ